MYFSEHGREELVETIDRLLMAKKMLVNKSQHYPNKTKFWSGGLNDVSKLNFFIQTLEHSLNARVDFDTEQETKEGKYGNEVHSFQIRLVELNNFNDLLSHVPNPKAWKGALEDLVKDKLGEVNDQDGFMEAEMHAKLGEEGNELHVEIEAIMFCTFHNFFEAFLNFEFELKQLLNNMKKMKHRKGRRSA